MLDKIMLDKIMELCNRARSNDWGLCVEPFHCQIALRENHGDVDTAFQWLIDNPVPRRACFSTLPAYSEKGYWSRDGFEERRLANHER